MECHQVNHLLMVFDFHFHLKFIDQIDLGDREWQEQIVDTEQFSIATFRSNFARRQILFLVQIPVAPAQINHFVLGAERT